MTIPKKSEVRDALELSHADYDYGGKEILEQLATLYLNGEIGEYASQEQKQDNTEYLHGVKCDGCTLKEKREVSEEELIKIIEHTSLYSDEAGKWGEYLAPMIACAIKKYIEEGI